MSDFIFVAEPVKIQQEWPSNDTVLLAVFAEIAKGGFTLRSFLLEASASNLPAIKAKMSLFYHYQCPAVVIKEWAKDLRRTENDKSFVMAMIDVVVSRVESELNCLPSDETLRLPAQSVTHENISKFSLDHLEGQLRNEAPYLSTTLIGFASANKRAADEAPKFASTIGAMLMYQKSQQMNYLQMSMGMYLYSKGCPKKVVSVLSELSLSVSHQTVLNSLKVLTKDAVATVRSKVMNNPWFPLYDNINISTRKYDQRIDNTDSFENGTTATIVIGKDLGEEMPVQVQSKTLGLEDLTFNEWNRLHFEKVVEFYLVDVLIRHYAGYNRCNVRVPQITPLEIEQTITFPLPSMKIDQSSIEGNLQIIETVMLRTLGLKKEWFVAGTKTIITGDQLTVARIDSLKELRQGDVTTYDRMEWAVPVMQLFHLQMLLCSTIFRTYYGDGFTPGSLAYNVSLLERKRLNPDSPNYHAANEILRHTFDAMVRRIWKLELRSDDLDAYVHKMDRTMVHDHISEKTHTIREKYFTSRDDLIQDFTDNTNTCNYASVNAALFIRDMTVYLELDEAISCGDVGRIEEVLVMINVMFQAGGMKNYANELMRVVYGLRHKWSPQWKSAIMSSWLINTKGEENGWILADLYQEHNNLLTKTIHSAKGSNMSWETLATSISANIRTFSKVASQIESEYEISHNSSYHSVVSAEKDIRLIQTSLDDSNIFIRNAPTKRVVQPARDLVAEGFDDDGCGEMWRAVSSRMM
ncbi:hypothetical protein BGZ65_007410 [Modicella reniformis]|uniref:DUF6589 domain-containing protein n=1 Tax=Modicella reniformis TaxID=1440133 RepID=A0A9P6JGY5_9FUNG|nr:hypothetical protein BGZ65_007410 [Modicella reniformis]